MRFEIYQPNILEKKSLKCLDMVMVLSAILGTSSHFGIKSEIDCPNDILYVKWAQMAAQFLWHRHVTLLNIYS